MSRRFYCTICTKKINYFWLIISAKNCYYNDNKRNRRLQKGNDITMAWYRVIFQKKDSSGFCKVAFETLDMAEQFRKEVGGYIEEYHEWINDRGHGFWKRI